MDWLQLFFSIGNPIAWVITLGGSGGGLSESRAQILASHGFASLALAYFREEDLPPVLKEIPLEYFKQRSSGLKNSQGSMENRLGFGAFPGAVN